jgi:histidinol phosphatase-like enzyme
MVTNQAGISRGYHDRDGFRVVQAAFIVGTVANAAATLTLLIDSGRLTHL